MTDKSRGDVAYALLDLGGELTDEQVADIQAAPDIIRVRVIRK